MAWDDLGHDTLISSADEMDVNNLTAREFLQILNHTFDVSGAVRTLYRFNGDAGTNYTRSESNNGAADITPNSQTGLIVDLTSSSDRFNIGFVYNLSDEEKLTIITEVVDGGAGVGNDPDRTEHASKWTNTVAQITRIQNVTGGGGGTSDYDTDSNMSIIGTD